MRKELHVFVSTVERGEEISVSSVTTSRDFVLISTPFGKVSANKEDLLSALKAISEFDAEFNSNEILSQGDKQPSFLEVEYGGN